MPSIDRGRRRDAGHADVRAARGVRRRHVRRDGCEPPRRAVTPFIVRHLGAGVSPHRAHPNCPARHSRCQMSCLSSGTGRDSRATTSRATTAGKRATLQPRAARVMSNYAPMETDLNGRHSPPGAYAVAPPAPHIALPKRPAKLGSSGRPITLVANHFFVDVRRMVELSLYDVTITPPAAPVRNDAPPGRGPPRQQERVLPARLCRCAPRPPRPRPPERHGRVPVDTSEPPKS